MEDAILAALVAFYGSERAAWRAHRRHRRAEGLAEGS
jgi:hypothetical protein